MITTTENTIPGKKIIEVLGVVVTPTILPTRDNSNGMKAAIDGMSKQAALLNADAVISVKFKLEQTFNPGIIFTSGAGVAYAYGTSVMLKDE